MKLNEALTLMAAQLKADPQKLMAFAAEDMLGGYDINEANRKFPMGSLWEPEGKILYALVRLLQPETVVEIGGWAGCSAAHLAAAVRANGHGHITSVDNGSEGMAHGHLLPDEFKSFVTLVNANGEDWLAAQPDHSIGLLFEDASHGTALVALLAKLALHKLEPGGVMVNHDAAHDFAFVGGGQRVNSPVGREVRDGLAQANVYFKPYLVEPSDCGVAITVIPGVRNLDKQSMKADARPVVEVKPQFGTDNDLISEAPRQIGNAHIESMSEPPPVKGKVIHESDGSGVTEFEIGEKPKRVRPSRAKAK